MPATPPPPPTIPGRLVSDGPDGLRHRLAGWTGTRVLWATPLWLAGWWWATRALLAAVQPGLPAWGLDLAVFLAWALPGALLALQLATLRTSQELVVRPGTLELRRRRGRRTRLHSYGFSVLRLDDAAVARVTLLPDGPTLELLPGGDAHDLSRRILAASRTEEAAPGRTASLQAKADVVPV